MIGPINPMLQTAAHRVLEVLGEAPHLGSRLGPLLGLLKTLGEEADSLTSNQLRQAQQIKVFLVRARDGDTPGWTCPQALIDYTPTAPEAFQAAALEAYVRRLRAGLVTLHAWLETTDTPEQRTLLADISLWLEAQATTAARHAPQMW
jgi:hypothetical protein